MWKDEIRKKYDIEFVGDEDNQTIITTNLLSASRFVEFDIAGKMLDLHQDLQRLGTNILESAVKLHNENIGPNSKKIDVSPIELIKLLHMYRQAVNGYVQRSEEYQ